MAHVACQNFHEIILCVRPSNQAWFDMADTEFDEQQWYENFRVTRDTFQVILTEIEREIARRNMPVHEAISARRRLAIVLYYLSSTAEYCTIANLFGVSISFVCSCIKEVSTVIVQKMKTKFVTIPKVEEVSKIMRIYKDKWQFPMCAGAIDGTHIPIIAPVVHADYGNQKGYHGIVMQAVVGWPGSVHDARFFPIQVYTRRKMKVPFLAASAKPYKGATYNRSFSVSQPTHFFPGLSNTSDVKRHFNYMLSRARMTVENTFRRWKGRFQKFLKRVDMQVETLVNVVVASCILHNICELQDNVFLEDWEPDVIPLGQPPAVAIVDAAATTDATDVRNALAQYFALEVPHSRRGRAARV